MANDERIAVRLSADLKKRLAIVCELTGLDEPTALRALVDAFCERIETDGGIFLPLKVISKNKPGVIVNERPFPSTDASLSPAQSSSMLNEEPEPRDAAVFQPQPKLTNTRAVMRKIAKEKAP